MTDGSTYSVTIPAMPGATALSSVKGAKKAFTAKWQKVTKCTTGYQLQYATAKNFKSGKKTITIANNKTTSKKVTGLDAKKTYYVRVRTYRTIDGKNYYSAWSNVKKVKTK